MFRTMFFSPRGPWPFPSLTKSWTSSNGMLLNSSAHIRRNDHTLVIITTSFEFFEYCLFTWIYVFINHENDALTGKATENPKKGSTLLGFGSGGKLKFLNYTRKVINIAIILVAESDGWWSWSCSSSHHDSRPLSRLKISSHDGSLIISY